jgi:hypothetical protein
MSVPEIKPTEPRAAQRNGCMSVILGLIGILMLLPGACVFAIAAFALPGLLVGLWRESLPNAHWVYLLTWAVFWAVCLLISYGGLKLLRRVMKDSKR